ncbi:hypothetical protein HPB51_015234 [Rhipicephalus microplus]|uniref:ABC transporter domain-containing protein n=1 Tax=Rhipicephalus microplus TaxID=6941 RepID=A0A9J6DNS9_RHIMP|nr:hypothetical protein HPB51_015234 [Rhipicephalus microplus]
MYTDAADKTSLAGTEHWVKGLDYRIMPAIIKERLNDVRLSDRANAFPKELSGGMKRRLTIALAFLTSPEVRVFRFAEEETTILEDWRCALAIQRLPQKMARETHEDRMPSQCKFRAGAKSSGEKFFRRDLRLARISAEFLWGQLLPWLSKKRSRLTSPRQEVVILGDVAVAAGVKKMLPNALKFCEHPNLDKLELRSLVKSTVRRAKDDEFGRLVQEGAECLPQDGKKA